MQQRETISRAGLRRRLDSFVDLLGAAAMRLRSAAKLYSQKDRPPERRSRPPSVLKIAGYALVLMDADGQVVWTGEWDSGGVFEFGRRQRLWVFCGFTNRSQRETEISEYEIELKGEDGAVVERFNNSFGDLVIIPPGQSKHFAAEWRM